MLPMIPNLTEVEIQEVILKVAHNHKNKDFGYFTEEDIIQEASIIALEQLPNFVDTRAAHGKDTKKALESWLNVVLSTRLSNLYRDKFIVPQRDSKKRKSHNPSRRQLFNPGVFDASLDFPDTTFDFQFTDELLEVLKSNMTTEELVVLECEINGEILPQYYRNKLKRKILQLCHASRQ